MSKIALSKTSPMMSSSRKPTFLSQFMRSMAIVIFLVALCPHVSSSPTPSSTLINQNTKINDEPDRFVLDSNEYQKTDDSSLLPSIVQESLSGSSPFRYAQPRTHANQFLISNVNDNENFVPKWSTRFFNDDQTNDIDDGLADYIPPSFFFNKRSSSGYNGGFSTLHKRKQSAKPPMEVMNEIVNSIYLKR